uniref:Endonuclease/exonuclease/phosphatase domain-containing protein n=1 Tax=Stegastes partitus TaxID=144197 RepID=A0A3B5A4F9_9TELE
MANIKIISVDIKGINHVVKRQKLLSYPRRENYLEHLKLHRSWVGHVFYSSNSSSNHGVAILLHRILAFRMDKEIKDKEGCYVLISGHIFGEHVVIGCVYAPTVFEPSFLPGLLANISSLSCSLMVLGGDFNCVLDPSIDQSPKDRRSQKSTNLLDFCKDMALFDAWRGNFIGYVHTDQILTLILVPHKWIIWLIGRLLYCVLQLTLLLL